ncbi:MAG: hypothetical protein FWB91_10645, partial [Defluviitaleaceae bacterium]|nr:hypothetical protein [Defluviitaleaceae bacterium]
KIFLTVGVLSFMLIAYLVSSILLQRHRAQDGFGCLPLGATNGEWAARFISERYLYLPSSIDELATRFPYIIRVEVYSERDATPLSPKYVRHIFTVYDLRVLEVYSGNVEIGEIVTTMQIKRLVGSERMLWAEPTFFREAGENPLRPEFIRNSIYVGEELILFLPTIRRGWELHSHWPQQLPTVQGLYRYTPAEVRAGHENWVFESVNEHNNLVLTEKDLYSCALTAGCKKPLSKSSKLTSLRKHYEMFSR